VACEGSVSSPRPSNRACASRAHGLPTSFTGWHALPPCVRSRTGGTRDFPDREAISAARYRFFAHVADHAHLPELVTLAETVEQWWDGIHAYVTTGITNAASEGNNRVIKLEARKAYGFRNRANQRLRSRCATTRRSRGVLTPHQVL